MESSRHPDAVKGNTDWWESATQQKVVAPIQLSSVYPAEEVRALSWTVPQFSSYRVVVLAPGPEISLVVQRHLELIDCALCYLP